MQQSASQIDWEEGRNGSLSASTSPLNTVRLTDLFALRVARG